jgi:anthranilate phosphoribosyltransferase
MSEKHEKHLGIDEISICGPTKIIKLNNGKVEDNLKKATSLCKEAIANGTALEKLLHLITYQGGEKGIETLESMLE